MARPRGRMARLSRLLGGLLAVVTLGVAGGVAVGGLGAGPSVAGAQAQCSAPAWDSGAMYNEGDVVSHNGHQWSANHWMWAGVEPGTGAPPWWVPWADVGPCEPGTTTTTAPGSTTTTTTGSTTTTTVPPSENVEDRFLARGPWAVTTGTASAPGTPGVFLVYPSSLGADSYDHPIITWGNGTISAPNPCQLTEQNGGIFTHLASWGYVVVCANTGQTETGTEIWAATEWLIAQDTNPSSVFFDKLDTTGIGAMGGSQGAGGIIRATGLSDGVIRSLFAWALPDPHWFNPPSPPAPNLSTLADPLFLASGTSDFIATQPAQQAYYNQIPGPAAKAALVGVGHEPATRERGYATAWFKYTLEEDSYARSAFVATGGNPPQISTDPDWTNWAGKNLP